MYSAPSSQQSKSAPDPQAGAPMSSYVRQSRGEDDGKKNYGVLLRSGTGRRWLLRALLPLMAGVVCYYLFSDWRIAVVAGGLAFVVYLVYTLRRYSEVPQWRKPSAAERRTEAQLRVMKRFGYKILHARAIHGGNGVIDHFVVGKRGAFAIDSEAWDKRLPVRNKLEKLYHGKFSKNERLDQALEEAQIAQRLVSEELGKEIFVRPSLVIYGPTMPWDIHRLRGIDVISGNNVRKWLRTGKDKLTEREIERIYAAAQRAMPPRH